MSSKTKEIVPLDTLTLMAIAAVAWIVFNELHTLVGHGGACILLGNELQGVTTTHAVCVTEPTFWGSKLYFAWGHVINAAAAILFFAVLRFGRITSPSLRYFLWISLCFNTFNIGNAILATPLVANGDWALFADGLKPALLWQAGLTIIGALIIVGGFRLAVRFWEPLIGGDEAERRQRIRRLTWTACITAFVTSTLTGLLSPLVFEWGLLQAVLAPISVFWMVLLPLWRGGPRLERLPSAIPLTRSTSWLLVAMVVVIAYALQATSLGTFPAALLR